MAIVSCHQSRLEALADEGSKSAAIVLKLRENPNKMFSMVQFGITLVSLLTGVYGGTEMAGPLSKYDQPDRHRRLHHLFDDHPR